MEQRRVRLGDVVDDYCTRERRITNHAVVAMIEDQIQLTRCTTCDTEHPYKAAKVPRRRKKSEAGVLYDQVLAGRDADAGGGGEEPAETGIAAASGAAGRSDDAPEPVVAVPTAPESEGAPDSTAPPLEPEDGPVRRPLIRATLPRPEGQPSARPLPEFTIRQAHGRGGFRNDARGQQRNGRPSSNGGRQGRPGGRSGFGHGRSGATFNQSGSRQDRQAGQPRHNRPSQHARSGKKRSR